MLASGRRVVTISCKVPSDASRRRILSVISFSNNRLSIKKRLANVTYI